MTSTVRQMIGERPPAGTQITTPTPDFFPMVNNRIRKTLSKTKEFQGLSTAIRENSLDDKALLEVVKFGYHSYITATSPHHDIKKKYHKMIKELSDDRIVEGAQMARNNPAWHLRHVGR
ncbi:hypothetical protein FNAPI_5704 [Fusarium napiforme]|uniref:Uncharacterized protein n=1 Tax=Fusarium napiforme TaxID=42672 RepID=A0A8H5N969_9HYPO|nr:hypothetical protein FNAPI_5704 [Fusarium napiforme]